MNQDEIIEMARQAGFEEISEHEWAGYTNSLESFAKLVEAHTCGQIFKPDWDNYRQGFIDGAVSEREACAKVCDDLWEDDYTAFACAEDIRARGEA